MDLEKILPEDGPPINEVTKYIEKYKNDLIVIKYGGNVLIDRNVFNNFITDLSVLNKLGLATVVIHGGGPRIKRELEKSNIQSKFIRGLRVTDKNIISIVESVLIDFNDDIVSSLKDKGTEGISIPAAVPEHSISSSDAREIRQGELMIPLLLDTAPASVWISRLVLMHVQRTGDCSIISTQTMNQFHIFFCNCKIKNIKIFF